MLKPTALSFVLVVAGLLIAPTANAYHGPCFTDSFGRCTQAPTSMITPADSPGDDAAYGDTPDQHFAYYLTHDDDVPNFQVWNFDVLKAQALRGCDLLRNGWDTYDISNALEAEVGYPHDVAANIIIAGAVIYCRELLPPPKY